MMAVTLFEMLEESGHDPFFLTTPFDFSIVNDKKPVLPVKTPLKRLGAVARNFPLDIVAIADIYQRLRKERPSVVHINAKYLFLPTMIVCSILEIPTVFTVPDYFIFCPTTFIRKPDGNNCLSYHGADCVDCLPVLTNGLFKRIIKLAPNFILKLFLLLRAKEFNYFLNKVSAFVVLSGISGKRLIDKGIPKDKIKLIYHYKLTLPSQTRENIKNPSVVFVGWLSEENGTDILIRAFLQVIKDIADAKLYLVGTGKDEFIRKIKEYINTNNISDNIIFLGKKDNSEALSIISHCDVVVVPHQWAKEFGPIILLEALALEKPVITSRIGATEEFVEDGINGFLITDYKNPDAFAEKIKYILDNKDTALAMGKESKRKIGFLLNNSSSLEIARLYDELLVSKAGRDCGA